MRIKRTILILSLLLGPAKLFSQNIDSLLQALEENTDRQQEIYILDKISSYYHDKDLQKSLQYNLMFMDSAKNLPDSAMWAKSLNRYGIVMSGQGNYDAAIYNHLQSIFISQLTGNKSREAINYINIGHVHGVLKEYEKMIDYSLKALEYYLNTPGADRATLALLYGNIGYAYSQLKDAENSIFYIEKAMEINQEMNNLRSLSLNYVTLGEVMIFQGDTVGGINSIKRCITIRHQIDAPLDVSLRHLRISEISLAQGNYGSAMHHVDSALIMANLTKKGSQIVSSMKFKAKIYRQLGNFESAYMLLEKATLVDDSLRALADKSTAIATTVEASNQIQSLESVIDIQKRRSDTQRIWIVSLILATIIILLIALRNLSLLRTKRRSNEILQKVNHQILKQSEELEKTQSELVNSEKMAVLGRLSASLGHELNTPIAGIKSNIEIIADAQRYEFIILSKIYDRLEPEAFMNAIHLVEASYLAQKNPTPPRERRRLKEILTDSLRVKYSDDADEIADKFDYLMVYDNIDKFSIILDHPLRNDLLELVSLVSSRTQAVLTSQQALERVNKIVVSLKTYSYKNVERQKVNFDLSKNIDTIFTLYEGMTKGIEITKNYLENSEYTGYPDELSQVWSNLITNSAHALNFKGKIIVNMEEDENFYTISFLDDGTGIPEEVGEQLFDPFYTTKPEGEGTGLGLGISRKVIERHGGTLTWKNLEQGVKFVATLQKNHVNSEAVLVH